MRSIYNHQTCKTLSWNSFRKQSQHCVRWRLLPFCLVIALVFALSTSSQVAQAAINLLSNPGVELSDFQSPERPSGWFSNSWGANNAYFFYLDTGYSGTRSVKVEIQDYISGDAKWWFRPVLVTPGADYTFSNYYRASVASTVMLVGTNAQGVDQYYHLADAPASDDWRALEVSFAVPDDVDAVTIYHLIAGNGFLQTDDYVLELTTGPMEMVIPNASLEDVDLEDSTRPAFWNYSRWGDNDVEFAYLDDYGYEGSRSVKLEVSNHVDGDAKWWFDPITAVPGKTFTFRNHYQSNVVTRLSLAVGTTAGEYIFVDLGQVEASDEWQEVSVNFVVPTNAATVTVFHLLEQDGYLITDNYSFLAADQPVQIPNASMEEVDPTTEPEQPERPQHWFSNSWGDHDATFTYLNNDGHTGSRSLKVTIEDYVSGDAKWYFERIALPPGDYTVSSFYRSNVETKVVVAIADAAGDITNVGLMNAPASETWRRYKDILTMPQWGVDFTIYHLLDQDGYLVTDDFSIVPYAYEGFDRALLTLTFDDGWEPNAYYALDVMKHFGFRSTQYYATTFIENPQVPSPQALIQRFLDAGHELGSHSVTHPSLPTLPPEDLAWELLHSKQYLQGAFAVPVRHFAAPFGDYSAPMLAETMEHYLSHRGVLEGYNSLDNFDITQLKVQNVLYSTTAAEVAAWVDKAQVDRTWLVLVYHAIVDNPTRYDTKPDIFYEHMAAVSASGIPVVTMTEALDELVMLGDVNRDGVVNAADMVPLVRHALGIEPLIDPFSRYAADVNRDGHINASDLVPLNRHALGVELLK